MAKRVVIITRQMVFQAADELWNDGNGVWPGTTSVARLLQKKYGNARKNNQLHEWVCEWQEEHKIVSSVILGATPEPLSENLQRLINALPNVAQSDIMAARDDERIKCKACLDAEKRAAEQNLSNKQHEVDALVAANTLLMDKVEAHEATIAQKEREIVTLRQQNTRLQNQQSRQKSAAELQEAPTSSQVTIPTDGQQPPATCAADDHNTGNAA